MLLPILLLFFSCNGSDTPEPTPTPTENYAPTSVGRTGAYVLEIKKSATFSGIDSTDPENKAMDYRIDPTGNGDWTPWQSVNSDLVHTYQVAGNMNPRIEVKDDKGLTHSSDVLTGNGKNIGVYDPDNNPINVELQVPKYIVADEEIKSTVEATDINNRPLVYSVDWEINSGNIVDSNNKEHSKTYSENDVGKKNLEGIAMNDYAVQNNATKEVEIGSPIPYAHIVTDAIDGEKYKVNWMNDGRAWMVENFKGEIGDADWYEGNKLDHEVHGRYYDASEIDEIEYRIMMLNGVEHKFRVATEEEWNNLANAYDNSSADLKYKEFSNGENVRNRKSWSL